MKKVLVILLYYRFIVWIIVCEPSHATIHNKQCTHKTRNISSVIGGHDERTLLDFNCREASHIFPITEVIFIGTTV